MALGRRKNHEKPACFLQCFWQSRISNHKFLCLGKAKLPQCIGASFVLDFRLPTLCFDQIKCPTSLKSHRIPKGGIFETNCKLPASTAGGVRFVMGPQSSIERWGCSPTIPLDPKRQPSQDSHGTFRALKSFSVCCVSPGSSMGGPAKLGIFRLWLVMYGCYYWWQGANDLNSPLPKWEPSITGWSFGLSPIGDKYGGVVLVAEKIRKLMINRCIHNEILDNLSSDESVKLPKRTMPTTLENCHSKLFWGLSGQTTFQKTLWSKKWSTKSWLFPKRSQKFYPTSAAPARFSLTLTKGP